MKYFFCGLIGIICFATLASAAFDQNCITARSAVLGTAFTALADDGSGPFYNPAGLIYVKKKEVQSAYSLFYPGLDIGSLNQMFFSAALPVNKNRVVSAAYSGLSLKDLYSEQVFQFTLSQKINFLWSLIGRSFIQNEFAVGINAKMLKSGYIVDDTMKLDPLFKGKNNGVTQFTIDAGIIVRIFSDQTKKFYSIGLSFFNMTQPDMGLKGEDKVPQIFNAGASIPIQKFGFMEKIRMDDPVFLVGANYRNSVINVNAGWENSFLNRLLFFRLGISRIDYTAGAGFKYDIGLEKSIILDYAFVLPYQIENTLGNHIISLRFQF